MVKILENFLLEFPDQKILSEAVDVPLCGREGGVPKRLPWVGKLSLGIIIVNLFREY